MPTELPFCPIVYSERCFLKRKTIKRLEVNRRFHSYVKDTVTGDDHSIDEIQDNHCLESVLFENGRGFHLAGDTAQEMFKINHIDLATVKPPGIFHPWER